jgi:hypothetical protein
MTGRAWTHKRAGDARFGGRAGIANWRRHVRFDDDDAQFAVGMLIKGNTLR